MPRDWNATSYEQVSAPLEAMGRDVLDRLELHGDERVLDAGCGTGRVTAALVERLPRGRSWPSTGRRRWSSRRASGWATAPRCSSPTCSSSRSTRRSTRSSRPRRSTGSPTTTGCSPSCCNALKPGGRLVAQCGGAGNVASRPARDRHGGAPRTRRLARAVELPVAGRHRGAPEAARLGRRLDVAFSRGLVTPEDPREYFGTVMLGVASRASAIRAIATPSWTRCWPSWTSPSSSTCASTSSPGALHRLRGLWPSARSSATSTMTPRRRALPTRAGRRSSRSRCGRIVIAALADRDVRRPTVVVAGDDRAARDLAPTCAPGCARGRSATTRAAASPTSRTSRRRRTSSACASPRSTR